MKLEFSFDDGDEADVGIAYLLNKKGFKGTFYIPTNHALTVSALRGIAKDHEIGGHTTTHPNDLKLLSDEDLKDEIESNREYLQRMTGQPINKFCYPRGRYDDRVVQAVKDAGFTEARTTLVLQTDLQEDPFRKHTTIHLFNRDEYQDTNWFNMARSMFQTAKDKGDQGYFHLWGHSWEVAENRDRYKFDELLKYIRDNHVNTN